LLSYLKNGHVETIKASVIPRKTRVKYQREEITTADGDFLHLDWAHSKAPSKKLIVLSHGLEGSSNAFYIKLCVEHFTRQGFDCLAWNQRSCSGKINKSVIFYHSGSTYDLKTVIDHITTNREYDEINMVGFSLGGSVTLKYLGEQSQQIHPSIKSATVFSTPLCLQSSSRQLAQGPMSFVYSYWFFKTIKPKLRQKRDLLSEHGIDVNKILKINRMHELDEHFTAPLHQFESVEDFYQKTSAINYINDIKVPTLIVNAINDPVLTPISYTKDSIKDNDLLHLEILDRGGHLGFSKCKDTKTYWPARKAQLFIARHNN
jgi:predicted alpha/beta-fold hydrolase